MIDRSRSIPGTRCPQRHRAQWFFHLSSRVVVPRSAAA